jgi:mono/diheme cytochrome c family protein
VKRAGGSWLGVVLVLVSRAAVAAAPDGERIERGRTLAERAECGRCHAMPEAAALPPVARERSCAGCHAWIHATREDPAAAARERKRFPLWDRYMATVASFLEVPDLSASAARLEPAAVARYLRAPFKVRPGLPEGMIRTGFSEDEALAVAEWLGSTSRPPGSALAAEAAAIPLSSAAADVAAGRQLFESLACGTCHGVEGRPATARASGPDLIFVRERLRPDRAAAFIADPRALGGEPRMPSYPISAAQAARLRDYLWAVAGSGARGAKVAAAPPDLPLLTRPVSYAEVRREVLDRICIHCHMDPRRNGGEGGPGNTGGLGYRGAGLDLESWAGIVRGALDARGKRVSILTAPHADTEPPLVARLRARYPEHARELAGPAAVAPGGPPGMPLGLPPLTPEQFRLVRSWVAQGAPGPAVAAARPLKVSARTAEGPKQ